MLQARSRFIPFVVAITAVVACTSKDAANNTASGSNAPTTGEVVAAPSASVGEPTAADYSNHELTMDEMRKWMAVTKGFMTFSGTSADSAAMSTVKIGNDPIAESEKKIEAIEPMKRIFATAGLTPREYHMIMGAYAMSGMATSKNFEFAKAHKAELDALMEEMKTVGR